MMTSRIQPNPCYSRSCIFFKMEMTSASACFLVAEALPVSFTRSETVTSRTEASFSRVSSRKFRCPASAMLMYLLVSLALAASST